MKGKIRNQPKTSGNTWHTNTDSFTHDHHSVEKLFWLEIVSKDFFTTDMMKLIP
jgi:hypothetical protein